MFHVSFRRVIPVKPDRLFGNHPFSAYAIFSEKVMFLTHLYAHLRKNVSFFGKFCIRIKLIILYVKRFDTERKLWPTFGAVGKILFSVLLTYFLLLWSFHLDAVFKQKMWFKASTVDMSGCSKCD